MDSLEISELIAPVTQGTEGMAGWHLIPGYPTLQNIIELLLDSPEFYQMFWNSVKITGTILAGQLLFAMPSAWGLARYEFPGKKQIYFLYIILMMLPFQVTMLSEYLVLDKIQLLDSRWSVILPGIFSTFSVFLMYRFFAGIPEEVLEAARMDGANEWQVFCHIGVPLGYAGIISAMVLQFLECWNQIERPMAFLKTKELWPLALYLPEIDMEKAGFAMAAALLALLPALFVFLYGQDYLEQGITATVQK
jgi:multiple sugar transport system permease protein